jgi:alkanesulfonate monooxygenase SsuD/methylene tetrahydromethanopterin reductase-like flavin-dependent oxidoreductase (luciferase family)
MNESRNTPLLGISIDPSAADAEEPFRRARVADEASLDIITLMDHPYNHELFDSWTLITALAMRTERVHVGSNVLNIPLRPPAMLAKMAASLDVLTGGRLELGIGAGAFWDGISAFGGPRRTPGEAYRSVKDALHILKGMWSSAGVPFTYEGDIYQVQAARSGPAPVGDIRIWVGATGPKMLRLVGNMADGLLVSYNYVRPDKLPRLNRLIDDGADEAGREPSDIRRGYNLMGVLDVGRRDTRIPGLKEDFINGTVEDWVDLLVQWYVDYRQDTFIFWPIAGNQNVQIETFAREVVPAFKEAVL